MIETLTIFEDVFVPWERVFLAGEWQAAGLLALTFRRVPPFHSCLVQAAASRCAGGRGLPDGRSSMESAGPDTSERS